MKINLVVKHLLAIFLFISVGCAHKEKIKEIDKPLKKIKYSVLKSLPTGKRKVSINGREFFSKYFLPPGAKYKKLNSKTNRFYAHVVVLGDRRPYDVEVTVYQQTKGHQWETVGTDEGLARVVARRIQNNLSKSREGVNIIDDFRPF